MISGTWLKIHTTMDSVKNSSMNLHFRREKQKGSTKYISLWQCPWSLNIHSFFCFPVMRQTVKKTAAFSRNYISVQMFSCVYVWIYCPDFSSWTGNFLLFLLISLICQSMSQFHPFSSIIYWGFGVICIIPRKWMGRRMFREITFVQCLPNDTWQSWDLNPGLLTPKCFLPQYVCSEQLLEEMDGRLGWAAWWLCGMGHRKGGFCEGCLR